MAQPLRKVRVLVVDDSPTFRAALCLALERDPAIEVVGQARDGREAVEMAERIRPDVVTMDVIMPVLDGLEASQLILAARPLPIVLMSTLARSSEQRLALNALRLGVVDVTNKPVLAGANGAAGIASVARLVKAAATVQVGRAALRSPRALAPSGRSGAIGLIAIAASTGGPPALEMILRALPPGGPAIVVAQHLAPSFSRGFAEWLRAATHRSVENVARPRQPLQPGHVYLAGENQHLRVAIDELEAVDAAPGELTPNADVLLRSVAESYGPAAIGVILTGMGNDGASGLKAMHAAGAWTIAQDRLTSVVYGMPRAAIDENAASEVLPIDQIGSRLRELWKP